MKHSFTLLFLLLLGTSFTCLAQPASEKTREVISDAPFVFKGKISSLNSTLTNEQDVKSSGIVQVTELIEVPAGLKGLALKQVSVRFLNIGRVKEGEQYLFFTDPYYFGQEVGVEEKYLVPASDSLYRSNIRLLIASAKNEKENRDLKQLVAGANMIFEGKVVRIRDIPYANKGMSEHDPMWKEAEIQVTDDVKNAGDRTVKVVFASSKDVMFYGAPKPKLGETGLFVLNPPDEKNVQLFQLFQRNVADNNSRFILQRSQIQKIKAIQ